MHSFPSDSKLKENKMELIERKFKLRVFCQGIRFKCYNKNIFSGDTYSFQQGADISTVKMGEARGVLFQTQKCQALPLVAALKRPKVFHPGAGELPWWTQVTVWIKHPICLPQRTSGVHGEGVGSLAEGLSTGCFPWLFSTQWPVLSYTTTNLGCLPWSWTVIRVVFHFLPGSFTSMLTNKMWDWFSNTEITWQDLAMSIPLASLSLQEWMTTSKRLTRYSPWTTLSPKQCSGTFWWGWSHQIRAGNCMYIYILTV